MEFYFIHQRSGVGFVDKANSNGSVCLGRNGVEGRGSVTQYYEFRQPSRASCREAEPRPCPALRWGGGKVFRKRCSATLVTGADGPHSGPRTENPRLNTSRSALPPQNSPVADSAQ